MPLIFILVLESDTKFNMHSHAEVLILTLERHCVITMTHTTLWVILIIHHHHHHLLDVREIGYCWPIPISLMQRILNVLP
jgi:hypothetical protein